MPESGLRVEFGRMPPIDAPPRPAPTVVANDRHVLGGGGSFVRIDRKTRAVKELRAVVAAAYAGAITCASRRAIVVVAPSRALCYVCVII